MCSACSDKLIRQGGIGFLATEIQFTIRERGAGRKEFFRQRKDAEEMSYKVKYQRLNIEFVPNDIEATVKNFVAAYYNMNHPTSVIARDNVVIVWKCYILGNWKVLATTSVQDGMYYELTYSDDNEHGEAHLYLDAYKRWENIDYRIDYDVERNIHFGRPCDPC